MCAASLPSQERVMTASKQPSADTIVFELWSMTSRNLYGTFSSEDEALAVVRQLVDDHGRDYGARFALGQEHSTGASQSIAMGEDLVQLAERRARVAPN